MHQIELEMQNAELRRTRDEAEAALEMYADLYEFAPVGYLTLGQSGVISALNLRGASLLRSDRASLLGRVFVSYLPAEKRPRFLRFLEKVVSGKEKESCETSLLRKVGAPVFVQVEAVADPTGGGCRLVLIEITERKRSEALLESTQALEELGLHQKDQILVLQERHAIMSQVINNIAHQWRQPLNALALVIQKLPIFYGSPEFDREFLEKNTDKAMNLVQDMSRTVDDFRDFYRSDTELISCRLNQIIETTLHLIKQKFQVEQIRIALHLEDDLTVYCYPNEFSLALLDILMNARDALVKRKVTDPLITLCSFADKGKTVLTVTDNAGGIDEEIMHHVFDPYFTTKGPEQGGGIGLFMSKTIIEKNMTGSLTVSNVQGGAMIRIEVADGN